MHFIVFQIFLQHIIDRRHSLGNVYSPIYKFSASRDLSCTLRLDILPIGLIINNLNYELEVVDQKSKSFCTVQPNHIAVPSNIDVSRSESEILYRH